MLCKLRLGNAGGNDGYPDVADFLPESFRDREDGKLSCALNRCCWADAVAADRREADELPRLLLLHNRKSHGDAVKNAADIDINHLIHSSTFL